MALSKPNTFLMAHLKTLAKPYRHLSLSPPPPFVSFRLLSFATPEDAAAERRRRKRRLRIEPPLSSLHRNQQQAQQAQKPQNPNAPKIPEHVSALTGNRLNLHNKILTLIRENDLEEASLYTRHSIYSNCRPTIFTVNSVLNALLRQCKYSDLLSLHRFITQAGVAPNVVTHNLVFQTYLDCRKPDTAMEHYKQMINDAPFNPSPTTYRILVKGLVDNGKLDRALELKDEISEKGYSPDPTVYHYLMSGFARNSDPDKVLALFEELKEKLGGGLVEDGVVYGSLMRGYFMKGLENEAMGFYDEAVGEGSRVKMSAVAYASVLEALTKGERFDQASSLFDRLTAEHNPPRRLTVNLGTFNVMAEGYCAQGRFAEAIEVFRKMGDYRVSPDTLSFNVLIEQLCNNGMLSEAEELYGEMGSKGVSPDEFTFVVLMDTCFKENRPDDAAGYFTKMVDSKLRPNLAVYDRLVDELVKVGKIEEAKSFFDIMVKKLKMDVKSYEFIIKVLSDSGRFDSVLNVVDTMLDDDGFEFTDEVKEFVGGELRKGGREDELAKLVEDKERLKAEAKAKEVEAAEATKNRARAAVSSLLPSKLFGNKEPESSSSSLDSEVEVARDEVSSDDVMRDEVSSEARDEVSSDDVVRDEVTSEARDEVLSDEVVRDEVSSEARDEVLSDDMVRDEVLSDEVVRDEVSSEARDEVLSDDVVRDEVSSDDVVRDEVSSDDVVRDEVSNEARDEVSSDDVDVAGKDGATTPL